MSDQIKKYCFTSLMQDGKACTNADLTILSHEGIELSCQNGLCVEFSFTEGADRHCITVQIDCHDCNCQPDIKTKCFCENSDDCPNGCEYCNDQGVCVSTCPTGQICDDDTCSDCATDEDCPCNQSCVQGRCSCPPSTPIIALDGCCVECTDNSHCDPCEVCRGGHCEPKDCQDGYCNPITGNCQECYLDSHCGDNECCIGGTCQCCDGFYRDPLTQLCTEEPECFTSEDCPDCYDCVNMNCQPRICPDGKICVNDDCVDGCQNPEDCPAGYGCLNGECVPCSSLQCTGPVSLCEQAKGCDCVNNVCTAVDCTVLDDCVVWDVVRPTVTPGTPIPGTGQPALSFNVTWEDLGLVTMGAGGGLFRDYRFTVTETTGAVGTLSTYNYVLGVGNSVSFKLSDPTPIQWNNVGFELNFQESSPGARTASIAVANLNWYNPDPANADESFFQDLFINPANWSYNVQAAAIPPSTSGGSSTPGSLKLCACNPNATIVGWNWTTIEGNLTVNFTPLPDGCLRATVQGCGTGSGTVTIDCAGFTSTIPIPPLPFDYSASNCCDPITDPTCSGNPGDNTPCNVVDVVHGDIVLSQFGYVAPNGNGLFRAVFQPDSVGISIFDWIRAARNVCWNTTGTMISASSFVPPSLSFLFHDVEYKTGDGCVQMGYTCSIRIAPCKEVKAEACLSGCDAFVVNIFNNNGVLTAITSMGTPAELAYAWFTNSTPPIFGGNSGAVSTGSTYTMPDPNTNILLVTLNVVWTVNGQICGDQDIITFVIDAIPGCRDEDACNYNANATVEDNTCCYLENVTYSCTSGLNIPTTCPGVSYYVLASPSNIPYTYPGMYLDPTRVHTVVGIKNGNEVCRAAIQPQQCYRCVTGDCVAAPVNSNFGEFTDPNCNFTCGCNLNIEVVHSCTNNLAGLTVWVNGGSGSYTVTILDDLGAELFTNASVVDNSPIYSPTFCNAHYQVVVTDNAGVPGACDPITYHTNCFDCADSQTALILTDPFNDVVQYSCSTERFHFTIVPDPCADFYDVVIKDSDNVVVGTGHWGDLPANQIASVGVDNACNGDYTVTITDSNGCSKTYTGVVDCDFCGDPIPECPLTSVNFTAMTTFSPPGFYKIFYQISIDPAAPTHTYTLEVYNVDFCGGSAIGSPWHQQTFSAPGGDYEGFLTGEWALPGVSTCYIGKIKGNAPYNSDCQLSYPFEVTIVPEPTGCSLTSYNISSYSAVNQRFTLSWTFANSSGDITLQATVWDSGTCGVGTPTVTTITGLPSNDNNHVFNLAQIDGIAQCVEFEIFDTNNPACTTGVVERSVPACACSVSLTDVTYNEGAGRLEIEWDGSCALEPVGFTIEIFERSVINCTGSTTLLTSYAVSSLSGLQYHSITAPGADRYIQVVITNDDNGACTDDACVVVPGCNNCTSQSFDVPAARLESVTDINSTVYLMPSGAFFECVDVGDPSAANDAAAQAIEDQLVALGDCGTPNVTWEALVPDGTDCAGITINHNVAGTYSGTDKFTGVTINGTTYSTNINTFVWLSGAATSITAGAESGIEAFILQALVQEGLPAVSVNCALDINTGGQEARQRYAITGVDPGVDIITVNYTHTATPTTSADFAACPTMPAGSLPGLCIRVTIQDSGIILASAQVGGVNYDVDGSGC